MEFKNAEKNHIETLKSIAKRVIVNNYTSFLGTDTIKVFLESGQSDNEIEEGINNCFVALKHDTIVGFIIINSNILHLIMIDSAFQNQGLGSKLLNFAERKMFEKYDVIQLESFEDNIAANQFYLKNGWTVKEKQIIEGFNINTICFEKIKRV